MLNTQDFLSKCFTLPGSQNTPSYSTERLKSRLHKQSLPTQAFKSLIFQSAQADFVCVAAPFRVTATVTATVTAMQPFPHRKSHISVTLQPHPVAIY